MKTKVEKISHRMSQKLLTFHFSLDQAAKVGTLADATTKR